MLCSACVGRGAGKRVPALPAARRAARGAARRRQARADEDRRHEGVLRGARAPSTTSSTAPRRISTRSSWRVWQADLDDATLWLDALPIHGRDRRARRRNGLVVAAARSEGRAVAVRRVRRGARARARPTARPRPARAHPHSRRLGRARPPGRRRRSAVRWLSPRARPRLAEFLATCHSWLKPGGMFAFIDEAGQPRVIRRSSMSNQPRQLKDGRSSRSSRSTTSRRARRGAARSRFRGGRGADDVALLRARSRDRMTDWLCAITTRRAPRIRRLVSAPRSLQPRPRRGRSVGTRSSSEAGAWLDALPIRGEIVELAAGTGWWSTRLAATRRASRVRRSRRAAGASAASGSPAAGLSAHVELRDAWAEPDRQVDAVVLRLLAQPRHARSARRVPRHLPTLAQARRHVRVHRFASRPELERDRPPDA